MSDGWRKLRDGDGNGCLYQHLWWSHVMHAMWAFSEVQMGGAAHNAEV